MEANKFPKTVMQFGFRVLTPALMHEIADSGLDRRMGALKIPLNILMRLLSDMAQRAAEINDPQLNVYMLALGLYEVEPQKIPEMMQLLMDEIHKENGK